MVDEFVMRSVYLRPSEDTLLRRLAHELDVTKSDLIRSAIAVKLRDWREANSNELVLRDLQSGIREPRASRAARASVADALPVVASTTAAAPKLDRRRMAEARELREFLESDREEMVLHDGAPESREGVDAVPAIVAPAHPPRVRVRGAK